MQSLLSFIDQGKLELSRGMQDKAKDAFEKLKLLQGRLKGAEEIKNIISQRKLQLKETLNRYTGLPKNITKGFSSFNREAYYYSQTVREYKEVLNDPDKLTQKALSLLNKLPAFREFMKQHSALAGLFGLPAGYGNVSSLGGLQTRAQVQSVMQNQLAVAGAGGQQILQQNMQAAQVQLNQLKDKLKGLGNESGDMDMPDFRPNNQRTKPFLKRLELSTNLQTQRANSVYPTTMDIGFSMGYRFSDKTIIGVGSSCKVGLGRDIRHIMFSGEGFSARSFIDFKIKGSFFLSGGLEFNYQRAFNDLRDTYKLDDWNESGLIGISKQMSLKNKLFKKTRLQLFWDFLSYRVPGSQALKFRLGYAFGK